MTQPAIPFLQRVQHEAQQTDLISLDLPQQQGLILFVPDCTPKQQTDLLQQCILALKNQNPPAVRTEPSPSADLDCQVTVEERTQLFKFLQS
jgi:hypothetical protein